MSEERRPTPGPEPPERSTSTVDQSFQPGGAPPQPAGEETYCYGHPKTPTRLRCSRCDRPICGRCAIPATVGQHCPECVAQARRSAPRVRSAMRARAPATVTIVVVSVIFYLAQRVVPGLTERLGASPPAIHAGEYWRLLTPMLLHAESMIFHLLFNMWVLWVYGPNVEEAYGTRRFLGIYLISGLTAGAASYAFNSCLILGVGASGAIFGVVGALLAYLYNRRRSQFVRQYMNGLLLFIIVNAVFGLLVPSIDNWAHGGGLIGGLLLGFGFDRISGPRKGAAAALLVAGAVMGLGVALVALRSATFTCPGI
ncbi:MAG: rhomboid family intramembrane serine protease [Actinomycetota bacterium]